MCSLMILMNYKLNTKQFTSSLFHKVSFALETNFTILKRKCDDTFQHARYTKAITHYNCNKWFQGTIAFPLKKTYTSLIPLEKLPPRFANSEHRIGATWRQFQFVLRVPASASVSSRAGKKVFLSQSLHCNESFLMSWCWQTSIRGLVIAVTFHYRVVCRDGLPACAWFTYVKRDRARFWTYELA